jgi:hypothetical protein
LRATSGTGWNQLPSAAAGSRRGRLQPDALELVRYIGDRLVLARGAGLAPFIFVAGQDADVTKQIVGRDRRGQGDGWQEKEGESEKAQNHPAA